MFDRNALDLGIIGTLEDQTVDRPVGYQELGDGPPAAIARTAAGVDKVLQGQTTVEEILATLPPQE